MKLKSIITLSIVCSFLSFIASPANEEVIWNGKGEATQTVTVIKSNEQPKVLYKFKNVRYGSIIDAGSFYIRTQPEAKQFIADLKGGISKMKESSKFEWTRSKYTVASGGSASKSKKGNFKIYVDEKFCPIGKKEALKLIKALEPVVATLKEK